MLSNGDDYGVTESSGCPVTPFSIISIGHGDGDSDGDDVVTG
jgi:hypothetical protein